MLDFWTLMLGLKMKHLQNKKEDIQNTLIKAQTIFNSRANQLWLLRAFFGSQKIKYSYEEKFLNMTWNLSWHYLEDVSGFTDGWKVSEYQTNIWQVSTKQSFFLTNSDQLFHVLAMHMRLYSIDSAYNPWRKLTQLPDRNSQ